MAVVKKGSSILGTDASTDPDKVIVHTTDERDALIENFWIRLSLEKRFPIAIWKIRQLFKASSSDEVALRVTDIDEKEYIDGRWIAYDSIIENDLDNDPNDGVCYFVLHETFFRGPIENTPNGSVDGMLESAEFPVRAIVWGRIGRDDDGNFVAFFEVADAPSIGTDHTGGGGLTSGTRIPPGGGDDDDDE